MKNGTLLRVASGFLLAFALRTTQGQSPHPPSAVPEWQTAAGGKLEFDVASVKPSAPGTPFASSTPLDGLDGPLSGNLFRANAILMPYLLFAFKINDSNQAQALWAHLPDWGKTEFFSVDARAAGTPTRDQVRLMVQGLLSDRFKLAVHREMQSREQYALVFSKAGKPGSELREHPAGKLCENSPDKSTTAAPSGDADASRYCGASMWNVNGQIHIHMTDVTAAQIASYLSGTGASRARGSFTPRTGIDGTGLNGRYDLDLQFAPDSDDPNNPGIAGATFAEALRNQLGLQLVERKGSVELLVIDHVEKPSPN